MGVSIFSDDVTPTRPNCLEPSGGSHGFIASVLTRQQWECQGKHAGDQGRLQDKVDCCRRQSTFLCDLSLAQKDSLKGSSEKGERELAGADHNSSGFQQLTWAPKQSRLSMAVPGPAQSLEWVIFWGKRA